VNNIDQSIDKYISVSAIVRNAKEAGYDFGSGNPINRIRHYIKLGLLPHMLRQQSGPHLSYTEGFLPLYSIVLLLKIQDLKQQGRNIDEIQVLISDELAHYKRSELLAKLGDFNRPANAFYSTLLVLSTLVVVFSLHTPHVETVFGNVGQVQPAKQLEIKDGLENISVSNKTGNKIPDVLGLDISLKDKPEPENMDLLFYKSVHSCIN